MTTGRSIDIGVVRRAFARSLRARVLLITVLLFTVVAVPTAVVFEHIVSEIIVRFGSLIAEKQILYDRTRGLETLLREASLAETLSRSPTLVAWARDEASPEKTALARAELERYRAAFKDKSYFFVIGQSGNYYFNDRDNSYTDGRPRYTLKPDNPRDGWYYKTAADTHGCQLNVDHDDNLAVTKVWINCVMRSDGEVLGIVGTGIDLSDFIREVVAAPQRGVESIFVDRSGAIQAHRDPQMVDFHSLTKDTKSKKTIFAVLDRDKDRAALQQMMDVVADGNSLIDSGYVEIGGHRVLAGVGYLGEIGWYNVTLMDLDAIVDRRLFVPIAVLMAVMLFAVTVLAALAFERLVLQRLDRLEHWVGRVGHGDFHVAEVDGGNDEIGRLSQAFGRMAATVGRQTEALETEVRDRTRELEELANLDPLTGIHNRRGFLTDARPVEGRAGMGLVLIDLDMLKSVNDGLGHQAGDAVLVACAARISGSLRPEDACGRWGGDEFIVRVAATSELQLHRIAERLQAAIGTPPMRVGERTIEVSASIGATIGEDGESFDAVAARADAALYAAKRAGRNRIVVTSARDATSGAGSS